MADKKKLTLENANIYCLVIFLIMSSQNKWNKAKNSYYKACKSIRITDKMKRLFFYNSVFRKKLKKELNEFLKDN